MTKTPGGFRVAVLTGWVVLGIAGLLYARARDIPNWAALPLLAAFLLEYPFYLVPVFPALRERLRGPSLTIYLLISMLLPYLAGCLGAIDFQWFGVARLAALAIAVGLWYKVLPVNPLADLAFLALFPAVLLGGYLNSIYISQIAGFRDLIILGHLALIHLFITALLVERRVPPTGFGFLPNPKEWRIGGIWFLVFLVVGVPTAYALGILRAPHAVVPWKFAGQFLGFLWVVAFSEDFLVWGVLKQWLEDWTSQPVVALVLSAVAFGLTHLWFGDFPNWAWVTIASVLGICCGMAFNQARSIKAAMVTHALVAASRLFFA